MIDVSRARDLAVANLLAQQSARGDWEGEMVWCPMITAQYAIVRTIVGRPVDPDTRDGIVRYLKSTRTADGAWGLHPEAASSVFVTTLAYVALRLLGAGPDEPLTKDARRWLERRPEHEGVLAMPTWGRLWLALLGLYDWRAVAPCPPELLLLPRSLPFHPSRYYCHTRLIYLAMAYLYGRRFTTNPRGLRHELAHELYGAPLDRVDFGAHRDRIGTTDLAVEPGPWLALARRGARVWERVHPGRVRRRALAVAVDRIVYEQRASRYHALSPVNGLLNCVALFAHDPRHPDLDASLAGLEAWRWQDTDGGVRFTGARSNSWDTAFALEALAAAGHDRAAPDALRGYRFLRDAQMRDELPQPGAHDRDPITGGWCFSDGTHRWPVSDCAAEAVSALLAVEDVAALAPAPADRIAADRLRDAAAFLLSRQNADGGFATYERRRGSAWLERLNPSEMFTRCMTEQSYTECTASALVALARLRSRLVPPPPALDTAMSRAVAFLRTTQRPDGSVPGFWGVNFTYGAFHFVRGLRAAGVSADDRQLQHAAAWLTGRQRADGGWGEHWSGCRDEQWVEHEDSQVVMTSWALLALLDVLGPAADAVHRGVAWLAARQKPDGSFPGGAVNGVFFGTAMLDYRLYPVYFPAWALARAAARP